MALAAMFLAGYILGVVISDWYWAQKLCPEKISCIDKRSRSRLCEDIYFAGAYDTEMQCNDLRR